MFTALSSDEARMSSSRLIQRLLRRRRRGATPSTLSPSRIEVRPPALWGQAEPIWLALWHWLREDPAAPVPRLRTLELARADFSAALQDLNTHPDAADLAQRAGHARSLRELWHLRAELYGVIARHLNQAEADRRLACVNRHFPVDAHGAALHAGTRHGQGHDV